MCLSFNGQVYQFLHGSLYGAVWGLVRHIFFYSPGAAFDSHKASNLSKKPLMLLYIYHQVTPFPAPGSAAAAKGKIAFPCMLRHALMSSCPWTHLTAVSSAEAATGIFRPVPPFSSLSAVPSNAIFVGMVLGVQRFSAKSLELIRRKEDITNDIFGFAMIWPYYRYCLNHSERRLLLHNRIVAGTVITAIVYANLLAWRPKKMRIVTDECTILCPTWPENFIM